MNTRNTRFTCGPHLLSILMLLFLVYDRLAELSTAVLLVLRVGALPAPRRVWIMSTWMAGCRPRMAGRRRGRCRAWLKMAVMFPESWRKRYRQNSGLCAWLFRKQRWKTLWKSITLFFFGLEGSWMEFLAKRCNGIFNKATFSKCQERRFPCPTYSKDKQFREMFLSHAYISCNNKHAYNSWCTQRRPWLYRGPCANCL